MSTHRFVWILMGITLISISVVYADSPAFVRIDLPQPVENYALGVAPGGDAVVGWTQVGDQRWAIRWTFKGGTEFLGDLPGGAVYAEATAAGSHGNMIVGLSESDIGIQGFAWTREWGMQVLTETHMPMFCSAAFDVSEDGRVIVGQAYNCGCATDGKAFRYTFDTGFEFLDGGTDSVLTVRPLKALGVSKDGTVIVGEGVSGRGYEAFMWTEEMGAQTLGDIPGGPYFSVANAVSADGMTIVGQSWSGEGLEAFRYDVRGILGMQGLGDLPDGMFQSNALAVCGDGSVIVGIGSTMEGDAAFIWTPQDGMRFLSDVLRENGIDLTGWELKGATGVCNAGRTIVGYGISPFGQTDLFAVRLPDGKGPPKTMGKATFIGLTK